MSDQLSKTNSQTPLMKQDTSESKPTPTPKKKSLYQRMQDRNRVEISEEELQKYTGMNRADLQDWAKDRPGELCDVNKFYWDEFKDIVNELHFLKIVDSRE
ncbi:hypothetical protein COL516b_011980 [Colletotrichum fioriniae]|nr:uncharacterized protein COL516b_011980 [Colletotrichum fioriniae]KAJ0296020.1 hypothetical protein COL516b_011980 [Colletotrichum fioriniae]